MASSLQHPEGSFAIEQLSIFSRLSQEAGERPSIFELEPLSVTESFSSRPLRSTTPAPTATLERGDEPLIHKDTANKDTVAAVNHGYSHTSKLDLVAPVFMVVAFVTGVAFSLGHHFYYHWLDGQTVGSTDTQQWSLRFGNAFAFLAKCCFCCSANIAFTQSLWRTLRKKYVSIKGLDAAFSASESLLSFFDPEMLSKIKIGTLLAVATWCLPFIALITPATLSVRTDLPQNTTTAFVPVPIMPHYLPLNLSERWRQDDSFYALLRWASLSEGLGHYSDPVFLDNLSPRFSRLTLSTATMGRVFTINRPSTNANSSYVVEFIAPAIRCQNSSIDIARNTTISAIHSQGYYRPSDDNYAFNISGLDFEHLTYYYSNVFYSSNGTSTGSRPTMNEEIGYFAMIPFEGAFDINTLEQDEHNFNDLGFGWGLKNELYIAIADHEADTNTTIPTFITCQLWNATWTVNITNTNNIQAVNVTETRLLNRVDEPLRRWASPRSYDHKVLHVNLNRAVYTAFFMGIANHLLGYMGAHHGKIGTSTMVRESGIQETVLTGSNEYVAMINNIIRGQRVSVQEWHKPLATMIEEFSQNVTLNFMADDYFSEMVNRSVVITTQATVYTYEPRNLLIAYGIAILATSIMVSIGFYALWSNGVSYNSSISTIIRTTQNHDIKEIVGNRTLGAQPLASDIAKTKLRFGIVQQQRGNSSHTPSVTTNDATDPTTHIGFGVQGTVHALPRRR